MEKMYQTEDTNIPDLSVLFVTYNRSDLLENALKSITNGLVSKQALLVCSDDGSEPAHVVALKKMGFDKLLLTEFNQGLGANVNKGLSAISSKYILLMQDDWTLVDEKCIATAITILEADASIAIVRFYGDPSILPLEPREANGVRYWVCNHLSEQYVQLTRQRHRVRVYSDTPHLRRAEVHQNIIGSYKEGVPMEECEMDYEDRFDAQHNYRIAFLSPTTTNYFQHEGKDRSFRTSKLRYRIDDQILAIVSRLGIRNSLAYRILRIPYQGLQRLLISLRLL